jgi:hypothetical protein
MVLIMLYFHLGVITYLAAQCYEMFREGYYRIDRCNIHIIPITICLWPFLWVLFASLLTYKGIQKCTGQH